MIPLINGKIIAALTPPLWFAYTAILALSKNNGTNPAMIITGEWNINSPAIAKNCPSAPQKKPTVTAFAGANP